MSQITTYKRFINIHNYHHNMQSDCYQLPHQHQSWPQAKAHLLKILQLPDLVSIAKQMRLINREQLFWNQEIFLASKLGEEEIVKIIKFAALCCLKVQGLFQGDLGMSRPITEGSGMSYTVLTKRQALCLVANMFFSTTQKQKNDKNLPHYINFRRLSRRPNQIVKTILNYFQRVQQQDSPKLDEQHIIFFRIAETPKFQTWLQCEQKLCEVRFHEKGSIEDLQKSIQIDFANKSIGGFFLSQTYTQQDIIFINSPELMPALLFHEYMKPNQCILMVGAERYSRYTGYLETYQYAGNFDDTRNIIQLKVSQNRSVAVKDSWISAIDAIPYFISSEFSDANLNRELNKAYVGFNVMRLDGGEKPISTGNWGSGAFNGNLQYKFLIQWLAASRAGRSIDYFSFSNENAKGIPTIIEKFNKYTVKQLTKILTKNRDRFQESRRVFKTLLKIYSKPQQIQEQNDS